MRINGCRKGRFHKGMNGIQVSAKGKDIECGWDHLFRSLRKKLSTPKRTLA
jgi:hypothetical protein